MLADTQAQTIQALADVVHAAKRCQHIIGTPEYPSEWDGWHATLDELLDDLVGR